MLLTLYLAIDYSKLLIIKFDYMDKFYLNMDYFTFYGLF